MVVTNVMEMLSLSMVFWLICSIYVFKKNVLPTSVDTVRLLNELTFPIRVTFLSKFGRAYAY